ncbi:zwei Ig domain protein zig-8-like [Amyelois transitella]|uniref:zwei Ig domain protein zig-8-like n=1 Tax=Amyelois transitella TaxID=680683 RepID=UPI0029907D7E|nr:zwei Ig domain protein zig-8-like [Amyelois transitella]
MCSDSVVSRVRGLRNRRHNRRPRTASKCAASLCVCSVSVAGRGACGAGGGASAMKARACAHLALLVLANITPPGACDVAGGAGSVNSLPASISGSRLVPSFDVNTPKNVTALVGKSAYLSCRVRNLGNRTVSWIRHRDLHILTVGSYTYTSDQRFQATHSPAADDWTLHIKWAQQRDAGVYECQVSTQPVRSFFVSLNVVVPSARILGGPDLHVDIGSTINLTCLIQFSPEPPAYIFWYHEDEVISYDSSRGGVSVVTEKGAATTSYLLVQDAAPADSGRYSCSPSNAEVASVRVHVLNGERPAAMQTGSAGLSNSSHCIMALLCACVLHGRLLRAQLAS